MTDTMETVSPVMTGLLHDSGQAEPGDIAANGYQSDGAPIGHSDQSGVEPERNIAATVKQRIGNSAIRSAERVWQHVGPTSVEQAFVDAHRRIAEHLPEGGRREAFERLSEKWRKTGRTWGIAATVVDFSLLGLTGYLLVASVRNDDAAIETYNRLSALLPNTIRDRMFARTDVLSAALNAAIMSGEPGAIDQSRSALIRHLRNRSGFAAGGIAAFQPIHRLARGAAKGVEWYGIGKAKAATYIESGKAGEHAKMIGSGVGSAVEASARYAAEHPDVIMKGMDTMEVMAKEKQRRKELEQRQRELEKRRQLRAEYERLRSEYLANNHDYLINKYGSAESIPEADIREHVRKTYGEKRLHDLLGAYQ